MSPFSYKLSFISGGERCSRNESIPRS